MTARYAIYFAPGDECELAHFGAYALGRLPNGSEDLSELVSRCSDESQNIAPLYYNQQWAVSMRTRPAHYGFHATLKAPFHLAEDTRESELLDSVAVFSNGQRAISLDTLMTRKISGFMALTLHEQPESLSRLAEQCVRAFEPFRAPLTNDDLQKRQPANLSDRQRAYLFEFGYPYVMDEFRFHMTLTSPLDTGSTHNQQHEYASWLTSLYSKFVQKVPVLDRLAVFSQADRASPFTRLMEFPFSQGD